MIITTTKLQKMMETNGISIIENSLEDNFGKFNYDLRIKNIIVIEGEEEKPKVLDEHKLPSGATVFVSTVEDINMPLNLIGIVTQRNSVIRRGLKIDAPIYHPGHHTKLFLRVTNLSNNEIALKSEQKIASIMFEELSESVEPYQGKYVEEFDYRGVGSFANDVPKVVRVDKKIENLENIEKSLYEKVITLLTIFVGIFSLINLNAEFLKDTSSIGEMLIYNLVSIGGIGIMVGLIGCILHSDKKMGKNTVVIGISLLLVLFAFICVKLI